MKETLKNYVCEICGGDLREIAEGHYVCPYCRTEFYKETTLPDELVLDLHSANRARSLQRFEDALNEYDRIISAYPDCFDAYWGATLSDYGIQYEKDYDGRMIPTVHRFSEMAVTENPYFVNAVSFCKNEKELSRIKNSAAEIERIRCEIKKTVGTQEPYDIFLCYKETPIGGVGGFTSEFYWASELYIKLRSEGYKVFFAKESLPAAKGDYEAHIFPALKSAKLMLILTTSIDNVESVWVKNEWSRFIRFARENPSEGKRFKVIQSGFKPELLPRELRKEQVLSHDSMGWVNQLYDVISDTFRDKEKEEAERKKREAEELEARIARSSEERIKELERRLEEERKNRLAEEQKRQEEDARRRREEEARRNEERIKELERQLALATSGSTAASKKEEAPKKDDSKAAETNFEVKLLTKGSSVVKTVVAVKNYFQLGLKEAKDIVDSAPVSLIKGISKAEAESFKEQLVLGGAQVELIDLSKVTPTESATETVSDTYDVILTKIGTRKLDLIKTIKTTLGLGLVDAKNLCETPNAVLSEMVSATEAELLKKSYEASGATITVVQHGNSVKKNGNSTVSVKPTPPKTSTVKPTLPGTEYVEIQLSEGFFKGYAKNGEPFEGTLRYTNGGVYEGTFKNGTRSGKGKMTFANGTVHDGEWIGGFLNGKGTSTQASGAVYIGDFLNSEHHGRGKMTYANGDIYDGDWITGKRSGKGRYTYASGNIYSGDWKDDKRTGMGTLTYTNGDVYVGELLNGIIHGKGKYTWGSGKWKGDCYEGDWSNGKRNGYGKYVYANGTVKEGRFVDNVFQGNTASAPYTPPAGSIFIEKTFTNGTYKGYAKNGYPHGKGVMTYNNGTKYDGEFFENKINGKGKYTYANGDFYEGDFVNGIRTGKGKYIYATGNVYEGDFVNGKITGKGKMVFKSGTVYEGDWVDGKMHGKGRHVWGEGQWKGDVYDGDWVNGSRTGYGVYTYASGKVLRGRFENNTFKG